MTLETNMSELRKLIDAAGLAPWATFPEWGDLLTLGEAIEASISAPIARATFVAEAAADLEKTAPDGLSGLNLDWAIDTAETARPTPQGCTELWGSVFQQHRRQ